MLKKFALAALLALTVAAGVSVADAPIPPCTGTGCPGTPFVK